MHKFLTFLSIIGIIIFSVILYKQFGFEPNSTPGAGSEEYMHQFKIYDYDEQGKLKNFVLAEHWELLPKRDYSLIKKPILWIYKKPNYFYKISSNYAHLLHNAFSKYPEFIKLFEDIRIEQQTLDPNYKAAAEFTLNTSYLEFDPKTELANTQAAVAIYKPGLVLQGVGMTADLKINQLDLKHNVRSQYKDPKLR